MRLPRDVFHRRPVMRPRRRTLGGSRRCRGKAKGAIAPRRAFCSYARRRPLLGTRRCPGRAKGVSAPRRAFCLGVPSGGRWLPLLT
eukprot:773484-Alexandrium_andersonii.AAC.1